MLCSLFPCSSGSYCLRFRSGGGGGRYDELSASGVLCQEEYDVHIDKFVSYQDLLGVTSACFLAHFHNFALSSFILSSVLHQDLLDLVSFMYYL